MSTRDDNQSMFNPSADWMEQQRKFGEQEAITALVQERDALRAEKSGPYFGHYQQSLTKIARLEARVAELEGDVARDAARYRFWRDCWGAERFLATISSVIRTLAQPLTKGDYNNFDIVSDAAIASAKEPSHD